MPDKLAVRHDGKLIQSRRILGDLIAAAPHLGKERDIRAERFCRPAGFLALSEVLVNAFLRQELEQCELQLHDLSSPSPFEPLSRSLSGLSGDGLSVGSPAFV